MGGWGAVWGAGGQHRGLGVSLGSHERLPPRGPVDARHRCVIGGLGGSIGGWGALWGPMSGCRLGDLWTLDIGAFGGGWGAA